MQHFKKKTMSTKISYSKKVTNKYSTNIVLFVNEKFNISNLRKYISNTEFAHIDQKLYTFMISNIILILYFCICL